MGAKSRVVVKKFNLKKNKSDPIRYGKIKNHKRRSDELNEIIVDKKKKKNWPPLETNSENRHRCLRNNYNSIIYVQYDAYYSVAQYNYIIIITSAYRVTPEDKKYKFVT